ncbi:MAG: glycosyltransferase family 4 protein [Candidatus Paceibacteria bacterium]
MRILHTVEFYEPSKGGAQEVIKQISERLAKRGHDVTVATSYHPDRRDLVINSVKIRQFRIQGNNVKGIKGEKQAYQEFLIKTPFDIMLNYAAQAWPTDLTFPILDKISAKKVFVPLGYSKLNDPGYKGYFEDLPNYLKKYDKLVYPSANYQDKIFGDRYGVSKKAVIIPNGAGEEFLAQPIGFRKKFGINTPYMILTVSNHYFAKGHSFVIEAFQAMRRRDATLVIIGNKPPTHTWYSCWPICKLKSFINSRIRIISGISRPYVVSAYQEADLFFFGSRVECAPLVMYESFAAKTPFITTLVGNVQDHKEVLMIVKTPRKMAEIANYLLENELKRESLAKKAFSLWQESHTWETIASRYEAMYQSLLVR